MDRKPHAASPLGRRRFVSVLGGAGLLGALGALTSALWAGRALAQTGKGGGTPPAGAPPGTAPPGASAAPAAPAAPAAEAPVISEEAKNLLAIVRGRYGAHLSDEQTTALLEALNNTVQSGQALRKRTLANAVEPDVIFRAQPPKAARATAAERSGQ